MDTTSCRLSSDNELVVLHDMTADVCLHKVTVKVDSAVNLFQNVPSVILVRVTMDMSDHVSVHGDVFGVTRYTVNELMSLDPVCLRSQGWSYYLDSCASWIARLILRQAAKLM